MWTNTAYPAQRGSNRRLFGCSQRKWCGCSLLEYPDTSTWVAAPYLCGKAYKIASIQFLQLPPTRLPIHIFHLFLTEASVSRERREMISFQSDSNLILWVQMVKSPWATGMNWFLFLGSPDQHPPRRLGYKWEVIMMIYIFLWMLLANPVHFP